MTVLMADSTQPAQIPASYKQMANRGAALYYDGRFACPPQVADTFPRRIMISVTGDPAAARRARVQDIERFDATPKDWPPFAAERERLGRDDATCYCSADVVGQVVDACKAAKAPAPSRWWIAWFVNSQPTRRQVIQEVRHLTGVELGPQVVWACQFLPGGHFDTSVIFGPPDWA
jgi:hypothetical protein